VIGAILVFPEIGFSYLGFAFGAVYYYLMRRRSMFTVPTSFIAIGTLLSRYGLLSIIGFAVAVYGWITYAFKKPV
jgi:hypothetical protein